MLLTLPAFAREFTYTYEGQTLTYTVISESAKTVETKAGDGWNLVPGNDVSGTLTIPDKVNDGNTVYTVISIGESAFISCSGLKEVEIGNLVASIGANAFKDCNNLTEVVIGNSVTSIGNNVFHDCSSLTKVIIGNSVKSIGEYAFAFCTGLKEVVIPNSVTSIEFCAFVDCTSLKEVAIGNSVKSIGGNAFNGCTGLKEVVIPNSVTSIEFCAFEGCSSLTKVIIGNSVTSIGNSTFKGCTVLTEVVFPNSVTSIGDYAFNGCSGLTEVVIPNSVTSIGKYAFASCTGLTELVIGNSVTTIGGFAFDSCSSLTEVVIPNSVTSIEGAAFRYCFAVKNLILEDGDKLLTFGQSVFASTLKRVYLGRNITDNSNSSPFQSQKNLEELVIGNSVTSIGNSTFNGCTVLTEVVFPNSVTSIGSYAFKDCTGLTEVVFPNSVTSIGKRVFDGCSRLENLVLEDGDKTIKSEGSIGGSLKRVYLGRNITDNSNSSPFIGQENLEELVIGNSVTSIGNYAFASCTGLTELVIGNSVTTIGSYAFAYCTGLIKVVIPNSVTSVGSYAFYSSYTIKNLILEDGDKALTLGKSSFTSIILEKIYLGRNITDNSNSCPFQSQTKLEELVIGNSVTTIGESAFKGCSALTEVVIPNSVTTIGYRAFLCGPALENLVLEDGDMTLNFEGSFGGSLKKVYLGRNISYSSASSPFQSQTKLEELEIGNSVTAIGSYAFEGCTGLTEIVIPNSVISIGESAFDGCSALENLVVEDGDKGLTFGSSVFASTLKKVYLGRNINYDSDLSPFKAQTKLEELEIGNSVTAIGSYAFEGCTGLTEIVIPNSVTSIGESAFSGCSGLIKGAYPDNLNNPFSSGVGVSYNYKGAVVEDGLIYGTEKKELYYAPLALSGEFTIPESVESIGENAFYGCNMLTKVISPRETPSEIAESSFAGLFDKVEAIVPDNSINSYLNTNWIYFTNLQTSSGFKPQQFTDDVFNYRLNSENTAILMPGDYKGMSSVSIPERVVLDGRFVAVNAIGRAFEDCNISVLVLPKKLEYISEGAFKNAKLPTSDLVLPSTLKTIEHDAFNGSTLGKVTLPEGMEFIGDRAFANSSITEINLPVAPGRDCFKNAKNLKKVTLSNAIDSISSSTFANCEALTRISLPSSLTSIGDNAFYGSALTSVTIPASVEKIGEGAFLAIEDLKSVTIEDGASLIDLNSKPFSTSVETLYLGRQWAGTFSNFTSLKSLTLDDNVTEVPDNCFKDCSQLASVTFGADVKTIGSQAFSGCALTELVLSPATETIGAQAFRGNALTEVAIGANVTEIGNSAFDISSLKSVSIEEGESAISFGKNPFSTSVETLYLGRQWSGSFNGLSKLKSLTLGNNVNEVPDNCFNGCSSLSSVSFGSDVKAIGSQAFSGCALTELVLSPATETIGAQAFDGNALTSLAIGANVTEIGEKAFDGANSLLGVSITAVKPPMAYNNTFSYYGCPLYVVPSENDVVKDAYYNNINCWYRFDGYDLIPIEKVKIEGADKITLEPGQTMKLSATFTPADASLPYIFWYSTNPAIATVDCEGNVTMAAADGISAQSDDDESQVCKIIARTLYSDVPAAEITINGNTTGVDDIEIDDAFPAAPVYNDIYNLQGICIKRDATDEDVKALAPGFYIIGGKKVLVK